ncbi:MAG: GAF domain-containing protein [Betaproteobacteria bacterium]
MSSAWLIAVLFVLVVALVAREIGARLAAERRARADAEEKLACAASLLDLNAALSRTPTSHELTRAALAELLHAFEATAGAVALATDDEPALRIDHAIGYEPPAAASQRLPLAPNTPLGDAIRHRELVVIESAEARQNDYPEAPPDELFAHDASTVFIPLVAANRALGVVALSFHRPRTFSGDEREMMLTAGRHTALALVRALSYERAERERLDGEEFRVRAAAEIRERQRAEEALRDSEGKYRALAGRTARLYELSASLSESITIDAVAKAIIRNGRAVVGASAGAVAVLTDEGRQFETLYAEEYTRMVVEAWHRFPADPGLCVTAAAGTREPVFVGSLGEWQRRFPRSAALAADGGYESAAVLPLVAEGAVLGVLSFHFAAPVNFNDEYAALLRSVAQHCAQALDRARLYEAAQRARTDAESANRAKDDFLSTLSHELRTPLNAMLGWASMLRAGTLDAGRTARALEALFSNATRQAHLIEELLDVSQIVAGRAALDPREFDPGDSLRGAVEAIMPLAEGKGVELRLDRLAPVAVVADPRRLEQVFLNLLSNAVKFTPAGGRIVVDTIVSDQTVAIRVADTGSGIDPAFLPHVFERFRQGDSTTSRRAGGLGLGLFIAQHLVQAQGGTIEVNSEGPGHGTTFTVCLPIARAPEATPRVPARHDVLPLPAPAIGPPLTGLRVLLVDDEPDAREVMASALETRGATVISAGSADDALQMLASAQVDVVLADIAMPDKDGYELIREIRRLPSHLARIPAAAVTAFASAEDQRQALAAGYQKHLAKPVPPAALVEAVAELAAGRVVH